MMLALALLGLVFCVVIGVAVVARWWPESATTATPWLLIVSVGAAGGIALTSGLYYLWLNSLAYLGVPYEVLEWAVMALAAVGLWHGFKNKPELKNPISTQAMRPYPQRRHLPSLALVTCLGLVAVLTLVTLIALIVTDPHGRWDAWAMWNFKAKFLYLSGPNWTDLFKATPQPDYPLLHPAAIARLWVYCGSEDMVGPQLMASTVMLLTVGVLGGVVWRLRGPVLGGIAGMLLMMTPLTIRQTAAQYADITLGLFMLSALAVLVVAWESEHGASRSRMLFLAGFLVSAAAWTKNEGIAFAMTFTVLAGLKTAPMSLRSIGRTLAPLVVGMLPLGMCLVSQKLCFAGQTDLFEPRSISQIFGHLVDPNRHQMILLAAWGSIRYTPPWIGVALAGAVIIANGLRLDRQARSTFLCIAGILLTQFICYYLIYLTSVADLQWLLGTTVHRLTVQLWPSLIFLMCLPACARGYSRSTPHALAV